MQLCKNNNNTRIWIQNKPKEKDTRRNKKNIYKTRFLDKDLKRNHFF